VGDQGIRGRGATVHTLQRRGAAVFDQAMIATRLQAYYNPLIAFLPQIGLAIVLLVGGATSSTAG
jgi:hypothetical protein